eukprot:scaffold121552_cov17-Tisochrysis_lutea.AAC.1
MLQIGKGQFIEDTIKPEGNLRCLNLSDDEVVGAVAISGSWEQGVEPVQDVDENKQVMKLELTREGFYGLVSIVAP